MIIAFYINEMNFRGVANSTYQYSLFNKTILKNKSIIFYNKKNRSNKKEVIEKFKKKFKVLAVTDFSEIDQFKEKYNLDVIYVQRELRKRGIETNQVHFRNDRYSIFKKFVKGKKFPNMDYLENKYLVLPIHHKVSEKDARYISSLINKLTK